MHTTSLSTRTCTQVYYTVAWRGPIHMVLCTAARYSRVQWTHRPYASIDDPVTGHQS